MVRWVVLSAGWEAPSQTTRKTRKSHRRSHHRHDCDQRRAGSCQDDSGRCSPRVVVSKEKKKEIVVIVEGKGGKGGGTLSSATSSSASTLSWAREVGGLGYGGTGTTTKGLEGGDCVVGVVIVVVEPSGFRTWGKEGRGMTTTARGEDSSSSSSSMSTLTPSTPIPAIKHPPSLLHDCGERERQCSCCGVTFGGGIGLAVRERRRDARWCWRRWDLTINMRREERGRGGKSTKTTTEEGQMLCGQGLRGKGGRGKTTATIAGGKVVSS